MFYFFQIIGYALITVISFLIIRKDYKKQNKEQGREHERGLLEKAPTVSTAGEENME